MSQNIHITLLGEMNGIQIIAITENIIFYSAYLFKMMMQRKKGIQTGQL